MAVTIRLNFPAGRYHATPWGRHVNEGVPEWPPSPWRLLRALIAVWKRTAQEVPEERVRRLLDGLAHPPCYHLPPFRVAHTRHYMPWEKKKVDDRTLVFDTFVCVDREDPLYIGWPDLVLDDGDRAVLELLLRNLSSLGRAEAWVLSQICDDNPEWNCIPAERTDTNPVPVFCPDRSTAFADFHYPLTNRNTRPKDYLFDCPRWHLCLDTETIHEKRWSSVPGAKWINYTRPRESTASTIVMANRQRVVTVVRYRIDAPVLPLVTETLPLAEKVRRGLLRECRQIVQSRHRDLSDLDIWRKSPAYWGKDESGRPGVGHRHAFFLPVDEDGDGRIDHVNVSAPMGFGDVELEAARRMREVQWGEAKPLVLALVGEGDVATFQGGVFRESTVWTSATPFVVTRHLKRRGQKRDRPEDCATPLDFARLVLRQELARRPGLPAVTAIEDLAGIGPRNLRPIQFERFRSKRTDDGGRRPAGGFRIVFESPVKGPICLGHSCHFGLGLFSAE